MTDPTLAAVQARAIAMCVWHGAIFLAALVAGLATLRTLRQCDKTAVDSGGAGVLLSLTVFGCALVGLIALSYVANQLPDAVAPLPAQEAPK